MSFSAFLGSKLVTFFQTESESVTLFGCETCTNIILLVVICKMKWAFNPEMNSRSPRRMHSLVDYE